MEGEDAISFVQTVNKTTFDFITEKEVDPEPSPESRQ